MTSRNVSGAPVGLTLCWPGLITARHCILGNPCRRPLGFPLVRARRYSPRPLPSLWRDVSIDSRELPYALSGSRYASCLACLEYLETHQSAFLGRVIWIPKEISRTLLRLA